MKITHLKGDLTSPKIMELATFVKELTREKPKQYITAVREMMPFVSPLHGPADVEKVPAVIFSSLYKEKGYICVQLTGRIDISRPIAYDQLYAQAVQAIRSGEQYWLTREEEEEMIRSNAVFQQRSLLMDYIFTYFRKPDPEEKGTPYSAPGLIDIVKRRSGRIFSDTSARTLGAELKAAGIEKKHTRQGNVYYLIEL